MNRILSFVCAIALMAIPIFAQITSSGSGNWSSTTPNAPWPGGTVPTSGDVIISDGNTVTIDQDVSITNLTVGGGASGVLQYQNTTTVRTLNISGDLTVKSGAQFNLGTQSSNVEHLLNLGGNVILENNSTLNIGNGASKGVVTNFNKAVAGDQTISSGGTPTSVIFGKIKLNRSSSTDKINCSVTCSTKGSNLAMQLTMGTWEQSAGTFSGPGTTATNLYLDQTNGNILVDGSGSMSFTSSITGTGGSNGFEGGLTINTSGTFTVGSLSNQARLQVSGGTLTIQSGTVNVGGRLTISGIANITGGNINISPQGGFTALAATSNAFEVASSGNFTMSGGTITLVTPIAATGTGLDVKLSTSATYNITGGTIRIGDGVSSTAGADGFQVSTHSVALYNLELNGDNTAASRMVNFTDNTNPRNVTVQNNLVINSGTVNANIGTTGSDITVGGSITNSGTLNLGTASTITLNGGSSQSLGTTFPSSVPNLMLNNTAGVNLDKAVSVSGTLTLGGNGSYTSLSNISGYTGLAYTATASQSTGAELPASLTNLKLANSSGVTINSAVSLSGTLTLGGNGTYTNLNNVSGQAGLVYSASTAQITGSELGSSITDLTINNATGVTLGSSTTVTGTLTMTSGNLILNGQTLTVGNSTSTLGSLTSTSGYITGTGTVKRWFGTSAISGTAGTFLMGVGTSNKSVMIGGTPSTGGTISVSYNDASTVSTPFGPSFDENALTFVNRFDANWVVSVGDGFAGSSLTLAINGNDIPGIAAVGDLNLSGATAAAPGTYSAPTGTTAAPVLNRIDLTESTLPSTYYVASTASSALPVELQSMSASSHDGTVTVSWSTATEINNAGFSVERRLGNSEWQTAGFVEGMGNSNTQHSYSFTDRNLTKGVYSYQLKQVDRNGSFTHSKSVEVSVSGMPTTLSLIGNYPNPFNPTTMISFSVPSAGWVVVKVFNILGKEVATVFDQFAESEQQFTAPFNAASLPSGIYFSQLEFGGQRIVKKMMLMK